MKMLLAPGIALCNQLGHGQKYGLITALLLLPIAILGYEVVQDNGSLWLNVAALVTTLIALYLLAALAHVQGETAQAFSTAIARFAKGDLSARVKLEGRDEMARVAKSFNEMGKEIKRMIARVSGHAEEVAGAAGKLSTRSAEVRSGSHQQSDATTSVAAAMQEMTQSVAQVSGHAADTEAASETACRLSEEGERVVREASTEMERIAQAFSHSAAQISELGGRTDEISKIVQVIRDIADQTNLLALNAAIEAARAGEQGRGFAVVADEVRKLAERTGNATAEISDMIEMIQHSTQSVVSGMEAGVGQVSHGVELASRAGDSLAHINKGAHETLRMVRDIAAAVKEQSTVSSDISESVERISSMLQSGSVAVDHMSGEAEHLDTVAASLKEAISRFSGGTANEAAQLVEKAAALYSSRGQQAAFEAFNDPHGEFVQRDLYIFVYDMEGTVRAHGGNPKLIGNNMRDAKDAKGALFVQDRIRIAQKAGSGWQDYMFKNPETGEIEGKTSFIRRVDNYIFGCGVYK
ncbi:MAG: methyl-accepting chemotaxis protein [Pseudazoarcus pumilus]|nr:methyl-accepting chemotaxis protein [Pseudazoarcus pumilus]